MASTVTQARRKAMASIVTQAGHRAMRSVVMQAEDAGQSDVNWTKVGRTDFRRTSEGCSDGNVVACTTATAMALQRCDVVACGVAAHDVAAL
ncbi:unnamed protein product [Sphagnum balticum]